MFRKLRGSFLVLLVLALALYFSGLAYSFVSYSDPDLIGILPLPTPPTGTTPTGTTPTPTGTTPTPIGTTPTGTTPTGTTPTGTTPTGTTPTPTGTTPAGTTAPQQANTEAHGFYYDCLTASEQDAFDLIYNGLVSRATSFDVGKHNAEEIGTAYWAVLYDHPEIFWTGSYQYTLGGSTTVVSPVYNCDADQIDQIAAQIEAVAQDVVDALPDDASTYDKVRWFYEWIVNETDYVKGSENDQNIQSVFLNHESVCAGYSSAFAYLCHMVDIPCGCVSGVATNDTGNTESHQWNIVTIDGVNTYVDATWGDPVSEDGTAGDTLRYDYLCITTEEIDRDHVAEQPASGLPLCDSRKYDFCMLAGTYIETFEREALDELITTARDNGESSLCFKLSSSEDFDAALAYLDSEDIYLGPLEGCTQHVWHHNEVLYTFDLSWT